MSTFTIPGLRKGKHRGVSVLAGQTPTELKADNAELTAAAEDLTCALSTAFLRGCQDSMRIARLEAERDAAVAEVKRLQRTAIRDAANIERLRRAVINARPRITQMDTQLVRPFAPEVVLPYVSPVPVVGLPQQREAS